MACWREIVVVFIFTLIGVWACEARAQQVPCVEKESGKRNLMKAGEMPAFSGLSGRGHVTQIWVNTKTGVWTATYIPTSGHPAWPTEYDITKLTMKRPMDLIRKRLTQ